MIANNRIKSFIGKTSILSKEFLKGYLVFLILFAVCLWHYRPEGASHPDYWYSKWAFLLALSSLAIGGLTYRLYESIPAALWMSWTLLMGIWVYAWRDSYYLFLGPYKIVAFAADSSYSAATLLILFLCIQEIHAAKIERYVLFSLGILGRISALMIITNFALGYFLPMHFPKMEPRNVGGFFDQASMEGCFMAMTLPLLAGQRFLLDLPIYIAILIFCKIAETSQPLGVLLGVLSFRLFLRAKTFNIKKGRVFTILLSLIGVGLGVGFYLNPNLFSSSNRFVIYKMVLSWQKQNWEWLTFGLGTGSFGRWAKLLQEEFHVFTSDWFYWMHSDYLQTFFEEGAIGLLLLLMTGFQGLYRTVRSGRWIVAEALFGYALCMLFNFPFRLPVFSFMGLFLLSCSLKD